MGSRLLRVAAITGLAVAACAASAPTEWADGPGWIIDPPDGCGIWGAWRLQDSTSQPGRTLIEFITLSGRRVSGYRFEVDCSSSQYRLLGKPHYGMIGREGPLREGRTFDLSERNTNLISGPMAAAVAQACLLHQKPDAKPDFSNLDEFVEATNRVPEDYFGDRTCVVFSGPPTISPPSKH